MLQIENNNGPLLLLKTIQVRHFYLHRVTVSGANYINKVLISAGDLAKEKIHMKLKALKAVQYTPS